VFGLIEKIQQKAEGAPDISALDRPRSSGRLTPALLRTAARWVVLVIGSRASALLSVVPCAPLPYPSVPSASPPDSERVPQLDRASGGEVGRAQGESGRRRCTPASSSAVEVGAMPTWHRNSLGVGRVARRARPDTKPFSRSLPRLTLKAGHKEGLPTTLTNPLARYAPAFELPFLQRKTNLNTGYY